MAQVDSVDKIIQRYFSLVTNEKFTYKGVVYEPKPVKVSPLLFRDYTCPVGCGGCCPRFSLDYLPKEVYRFPYLLTAREIEFNGYFVRVYSDKQEDHTNYHCRNLRMEDGRCNIHKNRPFSCDFELIRALAFEDKNTPNVLTQKLFGRGWALKRIDGERGALCEMTPITDQSIDEVVRKIQALQKWCVHFKLDNKCEKILGWIADIRPFLKFRPIDKIKPAIL